MGDRQRRTMGILSVLIATVVVFTSLEGVSGCSAKNHPHLMKKRPRLFTFSTNTVRSEKACSKQAKLLKKSEREVTRASCHLVEVNLHAFLAPTASNHRPHLPQLRCPTTPAWGR